MSIIRSLKLAGSRFVGSMFYEQDPGFREVILRLCRQGMVLAGALGLVAPLTFLGFYGGAGGRFGWDYAEPGVIVLWDQLFIISMGVLCLALARTRVGLRRGRLVVVVLVVAISLALLLDDVRRGDVTFTAAYLGLVLLFAIGAMPFHPWQAFVFGAIITVAYVLSICYGPAWLGVPSLALDAYRLYFMVLVPVACAGISGLLYYSRYEQYKNRRTAEHLKGRVRNQAETLREQAETLREQAETLREMEQLKSRFFANISHEFRTPLTLILGPVDDALAEDYGPVGGRLHRQLRVMQRSGRRLQHLINELLDLSKLEAGRMRLYARPGSLTNVLRGLVQEFSALAERKRITLQLHTPDAPTPPDALYFDAEKLEKVVHNLLSNAFKFTPTGGAVRVAVREGADEAGTFVEVSVRDTGPGIPPAQLPYLFDRFHQVGVAQAPEQAGTGIGLALAKELVALHGGSIRAESEPGFGSEFIVRLRRGTAHLRPEDLVEAGDESAFYPAHDAPLAPEDDAPEDPLLADAPPPADAPTILLVDDDADVRRYLASHLAASYHFAEAADGVEGLAQARAASPDLVIADVMMPNLDGYELCRALKDDARLYHVPVVLLTARASDEARIAGLEAGADDYITKPFNAAALLARVENLIEIRRLLRQRLSREMVVGPSKINVPAAEAVFLERVREAVEAHLGDSNFGVEWLADEVSLSTRQLRRRLKADLRLSPAGYIRMMRLERAAQLLEQHAGTVSEIAYQVGFHDADYFSRLFKQTFGVPPSEYEPDTTG